jgi:hypothetical protein
MEELTFGEKFIEVNFGELEKGRVQVVKELCAELVDILDEYRQESFDEGTFNSMFEKLYNHSLSEVLNAQLNIVKLLNFNK